MIGKAYISTFQYYNRCTQRMDFKSRPVLIIGKADDADYVVLPISRVTNVVNLDPEYDFQITPEDFPLMNLTRRSYVRTHKQSIIHAGDLVREIIDFREAYYDEYIDIIAKVEDFQKSIINNAL